MIYPRWVLLIFWAVISGCATRPVASPSPLPRATNPSVMLMSNEIPIKHKMICVGSKLFSTTDQPSATTLPVVLADGVTQVSCEVYGE